MRPRTCAPVPTTTRAPRSSHAPSGAGSARAAAAGCARTWATSRSGACRACPAGRRQCLQSSSGRAIKTRGGGVAATGAPALVARCRCRQGLHASPLHRRPALQQLRASMQQQQRTERLGPLLIERVDGLGGGRRLLHGGGRRRDLLALGCLRAGGGGSGASVGCRSCHADGAEHGGGPWRRLRAPRRPGGCQQRLQRRGPPRGSPWRRPAAVPCGAGPCAALTMMGAPHLAAQRPRQARRRWKWGPCCGPGTRALMQARGRGPAPRQCSHSTHSPRKLLESQPPPPIVAPASPCRLDPLRSPPPWPTYPPTRRST